jgi:hypothetical protein
VASLFIPREIVLVELLDSVKIFIGERLDSYEVL